MISIYKITNSLNNKSYIGLSGNICQRMRQHISTANNGNVRKLYQALRKYGTSIFYVQIIGSYEARENARQQERLFIAKYNTYSHGYNQSPGGDGTDPEKVKGDKNVFCRADVRAKVMESLHKRIPQIRQQMIEHNPMKSEVYREKVRLSKIGVSRTMEQRKKISMTRIKNKVAAGENNPAAKITAHEAREIYNSNESRKKLAIKYGMSLALIHAIKQRRVWKNVN